MTQELEIEMHDRHESQIVDLSEHAVLTYLLFLRQFIC